MVPLHAYPGAPEQSLHPDEASSWTAWQSAPSLWHTPSILGPQLPLVRSSFAVLLRACHQTLSVQSLCWASSSATLILLLEEQIASLAIPTALAD
eukprot:scaffold1100_cov254-Pinguiococcus_pyrenoidosus.AAC.2